MYHVSLETIVEYRDEPHARVRFIKVLSENIPQVHDKRSRAKEGLCGGRSNLPSTFTGLRVSNTVCIVVFPEFQICVARTLLTPPVSRYLRCL